MTIHRGKLATNPKIIEVRPLTRNDLSALAAPRVNPNVVSRFRDSHHRIARLFATGLRNHEVADLTGYSISRISTYANDPAMQELIARYREKVDDQFVESVDEFYSELKSNTRKAVRQIGEHLDAADETGDLLPLRSLLAIASDGADRIGYGKKTTNVNLNVNIAANLDRARARSGRSTVIDARPSPTDRASMPQPEHVPAIPQSPVPHPAGVPSSFRRRT